MMGLVEARSRRGFYVSQRTAEQMSDLYAFRKFLEVNAARLAAENAGLPHLREIDRILSELERLAKDPDNRAKTVEVDLQIHDLIDPGKRQRCAAPSKPATYGPIFVLYLGGSGEFLGRRPGLRRRRPSRAPSITSQGQGERSGARRQPDGCAYRQRADWTGKNAPESSRYAKCRSVGKVTPTRRTNFKNALEEIAWTSRISVSS